MPAWRWLSTLQKKVYLPGFRFSASDAVLWEIVSLQPICVAARPLEADVVGERGRVVEVDRHLPCLAAELGRVEGDRVGLGCQLQGRGLARRGRSAWWSSIRSSWPRSAPAGSRRPRPARRFACVDRRGRSARRRWSWRRPGPRSTRSVRQSRCALGGKLSLRRPIADRPSADSTSAIPKT